MTDEAMSPLRRRMIEDMTIRKFTAKTQHDYVQRIKNFAAFLGRSPDTAGFEDVRSYQLHLAASGAGAQVQGGLECGPWCRIARLRGDNPEGIGYRKDLRVDLRPWASDQSSPPS